MNRIKKVKNLIITSFVLYFLTNNSYELIKGYKSANDLVNSHDKNSNHFENIVAHRGFSGMYLDNSKESINEALNSECVDMIEIDVRFTQNKKIVLHHDSLIDFEDTFIKIEDLTLDSLDDEDTNYIVKNYPIYNLSEFTNNDQLFLYKRFLNKTLETIEEKLIFLSDIIKNYSFSKPLIIDVKTNTCDREFMDELNRILNDFQDYIYIQSDCFNFLNEMIKRYPDYKYLYIIKNNKSLKNKNNNFTGYTVKYSLLNKIKVLDDKLYLIYTINSNIKYYNLLKNKKYRRSMYIITDHPDYICALSDSKTLRK